MLLSPPSQKAGVLPGRLRLGYARDEITGHGFRAMACTCLNELGWHPDVIELQMAPRGAEQSPGSV